jgi:CYTH domain-containing protein
MATKLEIERKFLVKFPTSWSALSEMFDDLVDVKRISQTYLIAEEDEPSARVRKTVEGLTGDTTTVYHFNQKKPVDTGVHEETEREITQSQYEKALKKSNPKKVPVEKTRFVFKYNDQVFELDVFKGPLKGLAILEIELEDKNDTVELPPFLKVVKEVTKDKKFTNFSLADRKLHDKIKSQ